MPEQKTIQRRINKILVLNQYTIVLLICVLLVVIVAAVYYTQMLAEQAALPETNGVREQYELAKLAAEIRQIRSDTSGSLFWLKLIALLVTVGGAVGGYLLGQTHTTRKRIEFENRKNVDAVYQSMVQELSDESPLLRAAAAVKLGTILKSFPSEWTVDKTRKEQLIQLTKQVLAASLAIETDDKVLKTLTIAIVLHKRWEDDLTNNLKTKNRKKRYGDGRELDLSGAKAVDAYWAKVDFSYTDFYRADLIQASFREAILHNSQFREADLKNAVLVRAYCSGTNFKLADLRHADLTGARLRKINFDGAKVYGCKLAGKVSVPDLTAKVDNSKEADGTELISVEEWFKKFDPPVRVINSP